MRARERSTERVVARRIVSVPTRGGFFMHSCDGTRPFCFRFRSTRVAHGDARDGTDGVDRVVVDVRVDDGVVAGRVVAMRRARGAKGVFRARMGTGRGDAENARGGDEDARGDGGKRGGGGGASVGTGRGDRGADGYDMDSRVARDHGACGDCTRSRGDERACRWRSRWETRRTWGCMGRARIWTRGCSSGYFRDR